jgi:hypothetical protein
MNRADLLAHLADLGIPHDLSLRDLVARYGVVRSTFYDWDVVRIADARAIVPGQVEPPDFQPRLQPDLLPAPDISALVSAHPDERESHARTLAYLVERFGAATETSTSNTVSHTWIFDTASISLTTWPRELEAGVRVTNRAHERHPELARFSHLRVVVGHVVPLGEREKAWLTRASPLAPEGAAAFEPWMDVSRFSSPLRGCFRRLPDELSRRRRFWGIGSDAAAIVGMNGLDAFVLPADDLIDLELVRLSPARGPGGSKLIARYRDPFTSRDAERSKAIAEGPLPTSLDAAAHTVAQCLDKALRVTEWPDD